MNKASFIQEIYDACHRNQWSFSIRYEVGEDMFYDLEITSFPEGRVLYMKRPSYWDIELEKKAQEAERAQG